MSWRALTRSDRRTLDDRELRRPRQPEGQGLPEGQGQAQETVREAQGAPREAQAEAKRRHQREDGTMKRARLTAALVACLLLGSIGGAANASADFGIKG